MPPSQPQSSPLQIDDPRSPLIEALDLGQQQVISELRAAFGDAGAELYLVGGVVRDLILQRSTPADLDVATSAPPIRTKEIVAATSACSTYDVGERFGTIGVVFGDEAAPITVEITTYRSEHYLPGDRRPQVEFGQSIVDDLGRRDVTINAIALDIATGELLDPFHGQADLAMGVLRAVGNPDERLLEDPLRLLRIARLVAQLGFSVDPATRAAMSRHATALATISAERVYIEMCKLLVGEYADHGLDVLLETHLLCEAMPELMPLEGAALGHPGIHREKDLWDHTRRVVVQAPPRRRVRWAALLHDAAKPLTRSIDASGQVHFFGHERIGAELASTLLRRLHADRGTERGVHQLIDMHLRAASYDRASWTDSAVRRLALEAGENLEDLLDLVAADVTSARASRQRAAAARVQELRNHIARLEDEVAIASLQSPLNGDELMQMFSRRPGRWIADVKDRLRELVIDGDLAPNDIETATRIAQDLVAGLEAP